MPTDPYVDPRTGVLRNLLGISDANELATAEARLAAAAERVLFAEGLVLGDFDADHLRALHRHLFGEVYDWAGELRTVNMTKGGTLFALAEWVEPQACRLFVQRIFLQLVANRAGWELDWALVDRAENDALSIAAMADRDVFAPMLHRILRIAGQQQDGGPAG